MRVVIEMEILDRANGAIYANMRIDWESDVIPVVGMYIEDDAWNTRHKVVDVTLNFNRKISWVSLDGNIVCENEDACEKMVKKFEDEGWARAEEYDVGLNYPGTITRGGSRSQSWGNLFLGGDNAQLFERKMD